MLTPKKGTVIKMKVTYIKHSSFLLETKESMMLFDYFEGEIPKLNPQKPLYVFASHSHGDHFSPAIFQITHEGEVKYILSHDIFKSRVPEELLADTEFVRWNREYRVGKLKIETLKSTDMGVAFLIEEGGKTFYHAGDLNCWVWNGNTEQENREMREKYEREIMKLRGRNIDIAFVPLDPRQEEDFIYGMKIFLENASAKHVFPMHMWDDLSVVGKFKAMPENAAFKDTVMEIGTQPQVFEVG